MSGISLTSPVSRGQDGSIDIEYIGINYSGNKVIVRLKYDASGLTRDFTFEGGALLALRNNVSNFAGLRVAVLQYLQTLDAGLAGVVT